MKIVSLFLFFFTIHSSAADFSHDLRQLAKPAAEVTCPTCTQPLSHEKSDQLIDINGEKILITVVSLEEANGFVNDFLAETSIPFDYALDGCFARALKMAKMLDDKGIITGKAFLMGRLFASTKYGPVSWRYHVAPVILVKQPEGIKPYIIDPALFDHAVPYEQWKNSFSGVSPNGRRTSPPPMEYYTNRFIYDPTSSKEKRLEFSPGDLADAESTLARLMDIKRQLDARTK